MVISDSGLVSQVPIDGVTSSDLVTIILEDNTKYKEEIEDFGMFSKIFFESYEPKKQV